MQKTAADKYTQQNDTSKISMDIHSVSSG